MKAKKIFLAILSVMMAFCCAGLVACKDNNKPKPNPGGKDDVFDTSAYGNYYYLTTEDEYKLTVDASNFKMTRQDLKIESDKANYTGTYTYKDGVVSVTFKDNTTATATYDKTTGILTVKYDNSSLTFVKDVTYTVTFDSNGGSSVESQQVRNGQTATSPVPPVKDGYTFLKWYKDAALKNAYNFNNDPVTSDMTLYAKYGDKMAAEFTVTFRTGFEDLSVVEATTVDGKLSAADVPALTKEGYTFVGWWLSSYEDSAKLTAMYEEGYTFTQNETLYAVWNASGSDEMHVSVYGDKIKIYNPVTSGGAYDVEILNGKGVKVDGKDGLFSGTFDYDFSALDEGDYTVKVTYGGRTATAYYKNKALARVSSFRVEEGVFMFNEVANAEYYTVTVDCGNKDHEHENLKIKGNSYNFTSCEMQEGGIRFTVKAYADGYLTSTSEVYVYKKNLSEVTGLAYDSAKSELTWNAVANATNYVVTVNGESYVVDGTSYSLRYETGNVKVSVKAEAKGYISSTAALDVTISRLATPTNIKISNNVITWDAVEGATGYVVKMLGRENEVTGTSYTIPANTIGSTKITIVAKAANSANNSVASEEIAIEKNSTSMNSVYNNGKVAWNYLYNVDTYVVKVNDGEEFEVSGKNEADVVLTKEGENVIYVKAKSDKSWQHVDVTAYKITYEVSGGRTVETEYKAKGDPINLPESNKDGYDFGGWYLNKDGAQGNGEKYSDYKFTDTKNMTLYASWSPKTYTIYLKLDEADENPTEVYVKYREYFNLGVANGNDAAKMFKGWYDAAGGFGTAYTDRNGNSNFIFNNTSDKVLYSGWYTVLAFSDAVTDPKNLQVKKGRDLAEKDNLIEEVTIPEVYNGRKVTEINALAFEGCSILKTINIPESIEYLSISNIENASSGTGSAFQKDTLLEAVNVYGDGTHKTKYFSEDGVVYVNEDDGGVSLLLVPAAKKGSFRISDKADYIPSRVMQSSLVTELIIPASVKEIGGNAFDSAKFTRVEFESGTGSDLSLTIGDRAFKSCSSLTTVVLPAHLTEFNPKMFLSNSSLNTIEVNGTNGKYTSVDGMLCEKGESGENGLTLVYVPAGYSKNPAAAATKGNIEIPSKITRIGDYAFAVLNVPASAPTGGKVETEDDYTFGGVKYIYSVKIHYGVTYIGKGAFKNCANIKTVEFEEAQVSIGLKLDIREEAFAGCTAIKSITLPAHTKTVEKYAFSGATSLTTVTVNVIEGATLESGAFQNKENGDYYVTKVNIGKNTDIFDINGVFGGTKITAVEVDKENPYISSVEGVLFNAEGTTLLFYPSGKLGSYVIPEKVTEIASAVFSGKTNITEITIGKNVKIIGDRTFKDCRLLTSVIFEADGTEALDIRSEAFMGCSSLSEIVIPERTTNLGARAFANCTGFTSINIPANIENMFETEGEKKVFNIFEGCTRLATITVAAENANYLAEGNVLYTKENSVATELIFIPVRRTGEVHVPATVNFVIDRAFYQNMGVTEVVFDKTDNAEFVLGDEVFSGARALTSVSLPAGLKEIKEKSFLECARLESVTIPYTVEKIGELAFYGCAKLSSVNFEAVKEGETANKLEIADGAEYNGGTFGVFGECYSLETIVFPERTSVIGSYAFGQSSNAKTDSYLKTVTIPSTIESIGMYAFGYCTGITTIKMPETSALEDRGSIGAIGFGAFAGLDKLTAIKIPSSEKQYTVSGKAFVGTGITSVKIPASVKEIVSTDPTKTSATLYGAFTDMPALESVEFAANSVMTVISAGAFRDNDYLNKVVLPAGIQTIGDSAFYSAGEKTDKEFNVTFTAKEDGTYALKTIGNFAFGYAVNLKSISLPDGLTSIGNSAFFKTALTSVTIPYTVTTIGTSAFAGAADGRSELTEVTFNVGENGKSKLQAIKAGAFKNSRIVNVVFPETEQELILGGESNNVLAPGLFVGDTDLKTAHISLSIKDVTGVFEGCPNMTAISVAEGHTVYSSKENDPILYNANQTGIVYICGQLKGNNGVYAIDGNITTIDANAFAEQLSLTKVEIPASVMTIGEGAFKGSSNLVEVAFEHGNGVTSQLVSIGASAFANCTALTTINLPANSTFTVLETLVFSGCTSLTSITLPEGLLTIEQLALSNTGITDLTIPSTVKTLGDYNKYATSLSGVYSSLEHGILFSKESSGNFTAKLQKLTILGNPESIGIGAFAYCRSLTEVHLSKNLTTIGIGMFAGCQNLSTIKTVDEAGNVKGENGKAILPDGLIEIGNFAFSGAGIREITIPESVEKIGENKMGTSSTGESPFNHPSDYSGDYTSYSFYMNYPSALEKVTILTSKATYSNSTFLSCSALTTVVLNKNMTAIPAGMFNRTDSLRTIQEIDPVTGVVSGKEGEITIPSGVKTIGKDAFEKSGIERIVFGENVETIESGQFGIFWHADNLKSITVLGDKTVLKPSGTGSSAKAPLAAYCDSLTEVILNKNTTTINSQLINYAATFNTLKLYDPETKQTIGNDGEVWVPAAMETIPNLFLCNAASVKTVVMNDAVTEFETRAIYECYSFTTMKTYKVDENGNFVTDKDGNVVLYGNDGEVRFPSALATINAGALYGTVATTVVFAGNALKIIPDKAFERNKSLDTVKYVSGTDENGNEVIVGKEGEVWIPEGVTSVNTTILLNSPIKKVVLPTTLTKLGDGTSSEKDGTFYNSKTLQEVDILSNNITTVCAGVFAGCSGLKKVILPSNLPLIQKYFFKDCTSLEYIIVRDEEGNLSTEDNTTAVIPEGVTSIGDYAFYNTGIGSAKFGTKLKTIGDGAFSNCLNMTAFKIAEGNTNFKTSSGLLLDNAGNFLAYPAGLDKDVVMPEGITVIADKAFADSNIRSIHIPASVTEIGAEAFKNTTNLREVTFADNSRLSVIGDRAFQGSSLRKITIPASVAKLGTPAPENKGTTYYYKNTDLNKNGVFMDCDKLEEVVMLCNPTTIAQGTFAGCSRLKTVTLPETMLEIPEFTFYNCTSLVTVKTVSDDTVRGEDEVVTLPNSLREIGSGSFASTAIRSITIPAGVNTVGDLSFNCYLNPNARAVASSSLKTYSVFYNCVSLETVTFLGDSITMYDPYLFNGCASLTSADLPDNIEFIEDGTYYGCSSLRSVKLPADLKIIGNCAFQHSGITSITIPETVTDFVGYTTAQNKTTKLYEKKLASVSASNLPFRYCQSLKTVVCNARTLPMYMFADCTSLETATINSATIGNYLFSNDESLTKVTFADSVTSIGTYAFQNCTSLTSVTLPEKITKVGSNFFNGCTSLTSVNFKGTVTVIDSNAFKDCTSLSNITLPESLTKIDSGAFRNCTSLKTIELPAKLTTIGNTAFAESGLTEITIPKTVTSLGTTFNYDVGGYYWYDTTLVGSGVFAACENLTRVVFEEGFKGQVGAQTFMNCTNLSEVVLSNAITGIASGVFANTAISSITIPASVTAIGTHVFDNCDNLKSIEVDSKNTKFKSVNGVLYGNAISTVNAGEDVLIAYPSGKTDSTYTVAVSDILPGAFVGNDHLTRVTLPGNLVYYTYFSNATTAKKSSSVATGTNVHLGLFGNCSALTTVEFTGEIGFITNYMFKNCVSLKTVGTSDNLVEGKVILEDVTRIGDGAFANTGIEDLTVRNSSAIAYIGSTTTTTSYTLPNSDSNKMKGAFSNNASLVKAVIDTPIAYIPDMLFYNDPNLTDVTLPDTYTGVNAAAFMMTGIREFKAPDSLLYLGYKTTTTTNSTMGGYIFADCPNLENVELNNGLLVIGQYNFNNCSKITKLDIPDSVQWICRAALAGTSITEFVAPASLYSYGGFGYNSSPSVANVTVENAETTMSVGMFYGMKSIKNVDFSKANTTLTYARGMIANSGVETFKFPEGNYAGYVPYFFFTGTKVKTVDMSPIKYLYKYAFYKSGITEITIPGTVITVQDGVFRESTDLTTVVMEEGVKTISAEMFYGCTSLKRIVIPSTVETIASDAFTGCTSLTDVVLSEDNGVYEYKDGVIYSKAEKTVVAVLAAANGTDLTLEKLYSVSANVLNGASFKTITLDKSYEDIGEYALAGVTAERIVLSSNTKSIGEYAFKNANIASIELPATVKYIDANAFDGWTADQTITFTITEAEATAKYGTDWLNGCNATIVYKQA